MNVRRCSLRAPSDFEIAYGRLDAEIGLVSPYFQARYLLWQVVGEPDPSEDI